MFRRVLLLLSIFVSTVNAQESRITIAIGNINGNPKATGQLKTMLTTAFVKTSRYPF